MGRLSFHCGGSDHLAWLCKSYRRSAGANHWPQSARDADHDGGLSSSRAVRVSRTFWVCLPIPLASPTAQVSYRGVIRGRERERGGGALEWFFHRLLIGIENRQQVLICGLLNLQRAGLIDPTDAATDKLLVLVTQVPGEWLMTVCHAPAVCSRSDPRKAQHSPPARANWLNYRVASHLHQLSYRQHEDRFRAVS